MQRDAFVSLTAGKSTITATGFSRKSHTSKRSDIKNGKKLGQPSLEKLREDIAMVYQWMDNLQSSLVDKMKNIIEPIPSDIVGNQNSPSMLNINSKPISPPQPPSNFDTVTQSLINKVKSTIVEEMSRKRVTDTFRCTVAIYGLPVRKKLEGCV